MEDENRNRSVYFNTHDSTPSTPIPTTTNTTVSTTTATTTTTTTTTITTNTTTTTTTTTTITTATTTSTLPSTCTKETDQKKAHKKSSEWDVVNMSKQGQQQQELLVDDRAKTKLAQIKIAGYLHKWTNVVRGWKRRYFSLNNGVLKYSQREKTIDEKALTISLTHAVFLIQKRHTGRFVIDTGTLIFNLRAKTHEKRDEWVNALLRTQELLRILQLKDIAPSPITLNLQHSLGRNSRRKSLGNSAEPKVTLVPPVPIPTPITSTTTSTITIQDTINKIKRTKKQIKAVGALEKAESLRGNIGPSDKSPRGQSKKKEHHQNDKKKSKSKKESVFLLEEQEHLLKLRDDLLQHAKALINHANFLVQQQQQLQQQIQESMSNITHKKKKGSKTEREGTNKLSVSDSPHVISNTPPRELNSPVALREAKTTSEDQTSSEEYFDVADAWDGKDEDEDNSAASSTDEDFLTDNTGNRPSEPTPLKLSPLSRKNMSKALVLNLESLQVAPHKAFRLSLQDLLGLVPADFKPRTRLPHFRDPDLKLNIAKFIKDAIGKDLTRITMPVVLSEPLSLLQRLAEEYGAYTEVLDTAVKADYSPLRVAYVAAFAISCYTSTPERFYKPFNPILGETYELINKDKRYWLFSEQVSHHPPVSACICVGEGWTLSGHAEVKTKFWGKSFEVYPVGTQTLTFHAQNDVFVWNKATTVINNVLMGTKWVDHYGEMVVINRTTGDKCTLNLEKTNSWFGSNTTAKVRGSVYDNNNNPCYHIEGTWTDSLTAIPYTASGELNEKGKILLWEKSQWPDHLKEQFNYTSFAIAENELPSFLVPYLPITDSRWRPDQRAFENGEIDFSQSEKTRLENLQREMRRLREETGEEYKSMWFEENKTNGTYVYKGGYWERRMSKNWEGVTNIFGLDLQNFRNNVNNNNNNNNNNNTNTNNNTSDTEDDNEN